MSVAVIKADGCLLERMEKSDQNLQVIKCSVKLWRTFDRPLSVLMNSGKTWQDLIRLDMQRFPSLVRFMEYLHVRWRGRVNQEGAFNYEVRVFMHKITENHMYEVRTQIDWEEYLPILLANSDKYELKVDIKQQDMNRFQLRKLKVFGLFLIGTALVLTYTWKKYGRR